MKDKPPDMANWAGDEAWGALSVPTTPTGLLQTEGTTRFFKGGFGVCHSSVIQIWEEGAWKCAQCTVHSCNLQSGVVTTWMVEMEV